MRRPLAALIALAASVWLQGAPPAVTIYNQDFAVVRELVLLNLKAGLNHVEYAGMTANAEPDSVILRDPTGKATLQILEQNYRNDVASLGRMLDHFQGTTIQFERPNGTTVTGRIIRGQTTMQSNNYGQQFPIENLQPMIELDGQIRFDLPGIPLFPKNADRDGVNTLLKPVMSWTIRSDRQSAVDAELGYVTGGLNWKADYNIISSETNDRVDLIGWVTIANRSGKSFPEAQIALMAGDVNKEMLGQNGAYRIGGVGGMIAGAGPIAPPAVTEKPFDDYHLYKLSNRTTLLDNETKQVEFVRANGVATKTVYIYDGADFSRYANVYNVFEQIRNISDYGTQMTPKVAVMREFVNSIANSLGMPLPKGRLRFYRRDSAHIEFTGENNIDHTRWGRKTRRFAC